MTSRTRRTRAKDPETASAMIIIPRSQAHNEWIKEVTMNDTKTLQCAGTKSGGLACRARRITSSKFCFFHDPLKTKERSAARKAGGCRRSSCVPVVALTAPDRVLTSAADVAEMLAFSINELLRGRLEPKLANALGYLASTLLKALDVGELEGRLAALEAVTARPRQSAEIFSEEREEPEI
jgi:hypothetical protein